MAGVEPRYETYCGDDREILKLVASLNVKRRHLNESQRAYIAASMASGGRGGDRGNQHTGGKRQAANLPDASLTQAEAAEVWEVSERSVRDAKKVQKHGTPELQQSVADGKVSVSRAARAADLPPEQQVPAIEQRRKHKATPPVANADPPKNPPAWNKRAVGLELGYEAIDCLKRIPPKDPQRSSAFDLVARFIKGNKPEPTVELQGATLALPEDIIDGEPQFTHPSEWSKTALKNALRLLRKQADLCSRSGPYEVGRSLSTAQRRFADQIEAAAGKKQSAEGAGR
jgi:hypothetical protein